MRGTPRLTGTQRTAAQLALVVVVMVSLSFAAVPFYDWFCRVTGYGGATGRAEAAPGQLLDRTITVRFDASLERGMPWDFRPLQRSMTVRIGETGLAFYEAHNPTGRPVAGVASFNVTPDAAGGHFTKIACFCFEMQVLQPGERVQMPVTFFVDPAIAGDAEARLLQEITLSYTFHEAPIPEDQAMLTTAPDTDTARAAN
jgi:cytochrome c oxidase assembly protein subunit 11